MGQSTMRMLLMCALTFDISGQLPVLGLYPSELKILCRLNFLKMHWQR
jgi:hypothetical protein